MRCIDTCRGGIAPHDRRRGAQLHNTFDPGRVQWCMLSVTVYSSRGRECGPTFVSTTVSLPGVHVTHVGCAGTGRGEGEGEGGREERIEGKEGKVRMERRGGI